MNLNTIALVGKANKDDVGFLLLEWAVGYVV
jgi:hypothetical protein